MPSLKKFLLPNDPSKENFSLVGPISCLFDRFIPSCFPLVKNIMSEKFDIMLSVVPLEFLDTTQF